MRVVALIPSYLLCHCVWNIFGLICGCSSSLCPSPSPPAPPVLCVLLFLSQREVSLCFVVTGSLDGLVPLPLLRVYLLSRYFLFSSSRYKFPSLPSITSSSGCVPEEEEEVELLARNGCYIRRSMFVHFRLLHSLVCWLVLLLLSADGYHHRSIWAGSCTTRGMMKQSGVMSTCLCGLWSWNNKSCAWRSLPLHRLLCR